MTCKLTGPPVKALLAYTVMGGYASGPEYWERPLNGVVNRKVLEDLHSIDTFPRVTLLRVQIMEINWVNME